MRWPVRRLKTVADVSVSTIDKLSIEDQVPVRLCNYTDVYAGADIRDERPFMAATATPEQVRRFRLQVGQTLITKDSETADDIGAPAFVAESARDLVCGYHIALLTPKRSEIDPRYLFWAVSSPFCREQMAVAALGVTRYGLRMDAIKGLLVPTPTLGAQRRIVDYLDVEAARIDDLIERRSATLWLLAERARSVLEEHVKELDAPRAKLRRFVRSISQGVSSQAGSRPAGDGEWGVLKLSAVKWGSFIPNENKVLPPDFPIDDALRPRVGDLLVTRSNTPPTVGDVCAVVERPPRVLLPDLIYRVRLDERVDPEFASAVLRASAARAHLSGSARGTSQSMVKLRGEDILEVGIPVMSVDAQRHLVKQLNNRIAQQTELARRVQQLVAALAAHRRSLIAASIVGEGVPS